MYFKESETKKNLLRAFAGESQARNRYTFAAETAAAQKNYVVEAVFKFTAEQELAHAEVFYEHLKEENGENIEIDAAYPVNVSSDLCELLEAAVHNETEEYEDAYKNFAECAKTEGFPEIAYSFENIAKIEKTHADRFANILKLLKENKLFVSDCKTGFMCLNCGNIIEVTEVPQVCPVCQHERGYFIRLEFAPYSSK